MLHIQVKYKDPSQLIGSIGICFYHFAVYLLHTFRIFWGGDLHFLYSYTPLCLVDFSLIKCFNSLWLTFGFLFKVRVLHYIPWGPQTCNHPSSISLSWDYKHALLPLAFCTLSIALFYSCHRITFKILKLQYSNLNLYKFNLNNIK
jgi:hypothetical protein